MSRPCRGPVDVLRYHPLSVHLSCASSNPFIFIWRRADLAHDVVAGYLRAIQRAPFPPAHLWAVQVGWIGLVGEVYAVGG